MVFLAVVVMVVVILAGAVVMPGADAAVVVSFHIGLYLHTAHRAAAEDAEGNLPFTFLIGLFASGGEGTALGHILHIGLGPGQGLKAVLGQGPPKGSCIGMAKGRFALEIPDGGFFHGGAGVKDGNAVRHFQRQLNIVGNEENAVALIGKGAEILHGLFGQRQVEAGSGFVGDDEPGAFHQRRGEQHPPGHAAGKLKGIEIFRFFFQTEPFEQLLLSFHNALFLAVFPHGFAHLLQGIEKGGALGYQRDFLAPQSHNVLGGQLAVVEPDIAADVGVGREQTENGVGQQALPRARGTHHGDDLPFVNGDVEIGNDFQLPLTHSLFVLEKGNIEMLDLQNMFFIKTAHFFTSILGAVGIQQFP